MTIKERQDGEGGLETGAWATGIPLVTAWQLWYLSQVHSHNPDS